MIVFVTFLAIVACGDDQRCLCFAVACDNDKVCRSEFNIVVFLRSYGIKEIR